MLYERLTGGEYLRLVAGLKDADPAQIPEELAFFEIAHAAGKLVGGYSLGMRKKLGLAAAMLGSPDVLILDEPLNGLDVEMITAPFGRAVSPEVVAERIAADTGRSIRAVLLAHVDTGSSIRNDVPALRRISLRQTRRIIDRIDEAGLGDQLPGRSRNVADTRRDRRLGLRHLGDVAEHAQHRHRPRCRAHLLDERAVILLTLEAGRHAVVKLLRLQPKDAIDLV